MTKKRKKRYYRKRKAKTTYIYEIKAGPFYYIGKSNSPWKRLEVHKKKALDDEGTNKRKNRIFRKYIRNLKMRVIDRPKMPKWREREIHYIAAYRKKYGRNLVLNISNGGDGMSGNNYKDKIDRQIEKSRLANFQAALTIIFIVGLCVLCALN